MLLETKRTSLQRTCDVTVTSLNAPKRVRAYRLLRWSAVCHRAAAMMTS